MYIIEVIESQLRWVAGVFRIAQIGAAQFVKWSQKVSTNQALCESQIEIIDFPLYAVERVLLDETGKESNQFDYLDREQLLELLVTIEPGNDDQMVYFTYYVFEAEYQNDPAQGSLMGALFHVHVDNYFLKDFKVYGAKLILPSKYNKLVQDYNLAELKRIYQKLSVSGTLEKRREFAEEGYLAIFNQMNYDFACGKLTQRGISLLLPIINRAELLMGQKLWHERSLALLILLENASNQTPEKVLDYAAEAISALNKVLTEGKTEQSETYYNLALTYHYLVGVLPKEQVSHWLQAIGYLKQSAELNPLQTKWSFYLRLLYLPIKDETALLAETRSQEKAFFQQFTLNLGNSSTRLAYCLATEYRRFLEYLDWNGLGSGIFPMADYLYWLEMATNYQIEELPLTITLSQAGHFFHDEGVRLQRVDLLQTAMTHYQRLLNLEPDYAFTVIYLADSLEATAAIYCKQSEVTLASDFLNQAAVLYLAHLQSVKSNFSTLIHYAEFLERCLDYPELMSRPKLAKIKELALLAEEEGHGFYSQSGMIQARLALREVDETGVIFYLTRELLLHELCMKDEFQKCFDDSRFTSLSQINTFLLESIYFMQEIETNYYLDPVLKWEQLCEMNPEEVRIAWEKRKIELKNRG